MSYANSAALAADEEFVARLNACATEQAKIFKDDGRASIATLARTILTSGQAEILVPAVVTEPGFGDVTDQASIDDAQLLSAVQAVWPTIAEVVFPS